MAEVVMLDDLDAYIARAVEKVNNGVQAARKLGIQAELPPKLDFEVVAIIGWQALEAVTSETGTTKETGGTIETGTTKETTSGKDNGKTIEKNGGYQTETSKGTTSETQSGTDSKTSRGANTHTQNTDQVTDTYEA